MATQFDLVVRGGTVIDGTNRPRFRADVGVCGGRIAAVGDLGDAEAAEVVAADGLIVAPGFIDSHTHDDHALFAAPEMLPKISQGVTTVVTGNCGISSAPVPAWRPLPPPFNLLDLPEGAGFASFGGYARALAEAPASVNVAGLVGHTSLRLVAMGDDLERPATAREIAQMRALLQDCLAEGAIGLSSGLMYPPAIAAPTAEVIEVGRPLAACGGLYVTHMRNEEDDVLASLDETFEIGRELGVPVVISHHKVMYPRNFGRTAETLPAIRAAMGRQSVGLDCYPYHASATMLRSNPDFDDCRIIVAESEPHPECDGRELAEIAAEWGVKPHQAARRLQPGTAVYFSMDEDDVRRILAFPETMVGSDGICVGKRPHPRLWGTFPRVLGLYSREIGLFPLETAVWKMTGLTARTFGLADRGTLQPGAAADITVFDAETVRDAADFDHPKEAARGISAVVVNGRVTLRDGRHTGMRAGVPLLRAGAQAEA
ncbi:MAG: amidohydrolase family protein [Rhodospirillaceae bacterium]